LRLVPPGRYTAKGDLATDRLFAYPPAPARSRRSFRWSTMSRTPTVHRLLLALCACAGCALPGTRPTPSKALATESAASNPENGPQASSTGTDASSPPSNGPAKGNPPPVAATTGPDAANAVQAPKSPDPRVLDDVLAELAALGPLQPEAQQRLIDDLRKTDPAYWPMLVQTFRASMAYRRRNAERAADKTPDAMTKDNPTAETRVVKTSATESVGASGAAAAPSAQPSDGQPADAATQPVAADAVGPAAGKPASSATWQQHLQAAIGDLERQTSQSPHDADGLADQVYLRLLDLAAGRRDDALRPIPGITPAQQDYWSKQLFALSTYLDAQRVTDPGRRAAEAGIHLARAAASLAEQSPLIVRNLAFCTDVHSYGVLKRFDPAEFKPGQQILLYAEVENFKSEESPQGFHTSLEAHYQILDSQGRRVAHDDLPLTEEDCQNRRRDFFVHYFITLPKSIYDGGYKLELTLEDKQAKKIGQSTIDFSVKEKK